MSEMKKKSVGRPKTLDRQKIIDIAFTEYWIHGIHNVPLSTIAQLAEVSRPGIYKEFGGEDDLKAEVLKKYIKVSAEPVHNNYSNYKKYPNHLMNHLDALISDGNKYLTNNPNYTKFRPKNSIGCLLQRATISKYKLGPASKKVINDFEKIRLKQFEKYIKNAQKDGVFYKDIDSNFYAKYIYTQFSVIQTLRLNGTPKADIKNIVNTALKPLMQKEKSI